MKSKKSYILVILLITVFVFGTAAICNLCGITPPNTTEKVGSESTVPAGTAATQTVPETKAAVASVAEKTAKPQESTAVTTVPAVKENRNPVITGFLNPAQNNLTAEEFYDFVVQAEDPDGDILEYNWKVNTTIGFPPEFNPKEPKMKWLTPPDPGDYIVTVTVTDGRDGQATASMAITISRIAFNKNMPVIISEGGYTVFGGAVDNGSYIYAGDSFDNKFCLGFVSFDITELKGGIISFAALSLNGRQIYGDPSFYNPLYANALYWGKRPINQSDLSTQGTIIPSQWPDGAYSVNSAFDFLYYRVEQLLQNAIDTGQERFQVRIQFTGNLTDNDGVADGWRFDQGNATLTVSTKN
jgi:hypothetical protein